MLIYLDEYRKAKAARTAVQERHREDRQCINASPIPAVTTMICVEHQCEHRPRRPEDLAFVDVGQDLNRIQALATQF